jgi:hypothetical protein
MEARNIEQPSPQQEKSRCNTEFKFFSKNKPCFPVGHGNWVSKSDHQTYSSFTPNIRSCPVESIGRADAVIQPFGAGAFALKVTDRAHYRGDGAVDLQTLDYGQTYGPHSFAAGINNTTLTSGGIALGTGNMSIGENSVVGGYQSAARGDGSASFSETANVYSTQSIGSGSFTSGYNQRGFLCAVGQGSRAGGHVGNGTNLEASPGFIFTFGDGSDAYGKTVDGIILTEGAGAITRGFANGGDIRAAEASTALGYADYKEQHYAWDKNAVIGRNIINHTPYSLASGQHATTQQNVYTDETGVTPANAIQTTASYQLANGQDSSDISNGIGLIAGAMGYGLTPVSGTSSAFTNNAGYGYSEYMEWEDAAFGTTGLAKFVTVNSDGKLVLATTSSEVVGVAVPKNGDNGFVSNSKDLYWQGALQTDAIGTIAMQPSFSQAAQQTLRDYNVVFTQSLLHLIQSTAPILFIEAMLLYPLNVTVIVNDIVTYRPISDTERSALIDSLEDLPEVRKVVTNPFYDPNEPYISRWSRPEWAIVRLVGQVRVYQDGTVQLGDKVDCNALGIATKGTTWFVIGVSTDTVTILFR